MRNKKLILHIGAHKTASTYLQNTMYQNRALLRSNGIKYIGIWQMRQHITPGLRNEKVSAKEIREFVKSRIPKDCDQAILSDENVLGWSEDIHSSGQAYPNAMTQLMKLRDAISDQQIQVILVVRNYADFISSMYCEALRHRKSFITFRRYIRDFDYLSWSWADLVDELISLFGKDRVQVLRFEDLIRDFRLFFQLIIPKGNSAMKLPPKTSDQRSSFLHKTIVSLEHMMEIEDSKLINKMKGNLNNFYKKQGFVRKFDPWTTLERALLTQRYQEETL